MVRRAEEMTLEKNGKSDKDLNALKSYSEFLNFSSVREIIDDYIAPITDQIPAMKKDLREIKLY